MRVRFHHVSDCIQSIIGIWRLAGLRGVLQRFAVMAVIFSGVAIWSVWPMPRTMGSQIPTSQEGIATVPLFNAWTIAWNGHCVQRGMKGYWNAPIFHPLPKAFALSEPQPATLVVAPVIWWWRSPAMAYNSYLLLSLVLNGLFTVHLMRTLRLGWIAAIVAGVAMIQHPLMHLQSDVLQLMPMWGILWTLAALVRLREVAIPHEAGIKEECAEEAVTPHAKSPATYSMFRTAIIRGIETALAFGSVFAVSVHHGLFLSLLLAATGAMIIPWRHFRRWLPGATVAIFVAAGLIAPLVIPIASVMRENAFDRAESLVAQLSVTPASWLVEPATAFIKCRLVAREGLWHMSPGATRTAMALTAACLVMLPRFRSRSAALGFLLAFGGIALLLSLGVNLQPAGWKVWTTISLYVPGFSQVRSAFRFAYFSQLVVIVLAAVGLDLLLELGRGWSPGRSIGRWLWSGVLTVLALLMMFEVPPPAVQLVGVPQLQSADWKTYITSHLHNGNGILLMPYVQGQTVRDFDVTARWMVTLVQDDIPMVNGYSGFFPAAHFRLQKLIETNGLSGETLQMLNESKIQFVVVPLFGLPQATTPGAGSIVLETVFSDSTGMVILELRRRE